MSRTVLLLAVLAVALAVVAAKPKPGKLDSINVDEVLKNQRLFNTYVDCIMDKKTCSAEGTELKQRLPKDLESKCAECTDSEKARAKKVILFLKKERPEVWEDFKKKYDPEGKWGDLEWTVA